MWDDAVYKFVVLTTSSFCLCSKRGFEVRSFGTGTHVKLPGPSPDKPNVYDFKTTYEQMYNDLVRKDKELYPLHAAFFSTLRHVHSKPHKETRPVCLLIFVSCRWSSSDYTHNGGSPVGQSHVGIFRSRWHKLDYKKYGEGNVLLQG